MKEYEVEITRIDETGRVNKSDVLTREIPLTIYINDKELVTLLCGPFDLKQLCAGFIFSSGLITSSEDIENIVIVEKSWNCYATVKNKDVLSELVYKRMYTSGCGRGTLVYNALDSLHKKKNTSVFKIEHEAVFKLMQDFDRESEGFKKTGGVHSAALADKDSIIIFKEDIGRHNAVDKVIGAALTDGVSFKDKVIITSGRISSEIVFKIKKTQIPVIISRSAPTDQAVKNALDMNLTLVGFVRGRRMNIYSAQERVL